MINDLGSQAQINAVGGVHEKKGPQAQQQAFEQGKHHQQHTQHTEGARAVVDDHLVDHLLDQQGIDKAEELHKETSHQHLHQHGAVLTQGWQEPAETKLAARRVLIHPQGQHLPLVSPLVAKVGDAHLLVADGRDAQHQRAGRGAVNQGQTVSPAHHVGRCEPGEAIRLDLQQLGLQAHRFRHRSRQSEGGFAVPLHLVCENAPQQFAPEGKIEKLAQHQESRHRRLEGPHPLDPGEVLRPLPTLILRFDRQAQIDRRSGSNGAGLQGFALLLPAGQQLGVPAIAAALRLQRCWLQNRGQALPLDPEHPCRSLLLQARFAP